VCFEQGRQYLLHMREARQIDRLQFVINLKTAKALGLTPIRDLRTRHRSENALDSCVATP